ncbi:PilZ domain-containing protein [Desulfuromonas sp. CSMB_57]|jgi:hypothetical protein|uniref:PilZ domain-containing protein n=1 Tax=Desulfuromonas sp. CSMB_57 TaxID=2807629 RepID=UPI001CD65259|nr:PilZ domain-containing protein [Desulfuromonas sp. CSMB_57]
MSHVLIFDRHPPTLAIYRRALEELGADCETAGNFTELKQTLLQRPFNGVVIDVLTAVRANPEEKLLLQEIAEAYPTLRVRWDAGAARIRGLVFGKSLAGDHPLRYFLEHVCRNHPPRAFRASRRHAIHLNGLLSRDSEFPPDQLERTVTLDISLGGCFLVTFDDHWENQQHAWLQLLELSDPTPIKIIIRRVNPWGKKPSIPGLGVEFLQLHPDQAEELRQRFQKR